MTFLRCLDHEPYLPQSINRIRGHVSPPKSLASPTLATRSTAWRYYWVNEDTGSRGRSQY
uniref:Uncharacterized protein n=1 Tax=Picea glauca TaxID=3330 RepID=A0A124GMP8_PICGL|nr:hypothetical protein ABT39_MTgene1862 [Picea glauca]